jgi:hypothetical protein
MGHWGIEASIFPLCFLFSLALSEPKEKKDSSTGCNHPLFSVPFSFYFSSLYFLSSEQMFSTVIVSIEPDPHHITTRVKLTRAQPTTWLWLLAILRYNCVCAWCIYLYLYMYPRSCLRPIIAYTDRFLHAYAQPNTSTTEPLSLFSKLHNAAACIGTSADGLRSIQSAIFNILGAW